MTQSICAQKQQDHGASFSAVISCVLAVIDTKSDWDEILKLQKNYAQKNYTWVEFDKIFLRKLKHDRTSSDPRPTASAI